MVTRPGFIASRESTVTAQQRDYQAWKARVASALDVRWPERKLELLGEQDLHLVWRWQAGHPPARVANALVRDLRINERLEEDAS